MAIEVKTGLETNSLLYCKKKTYKQKRSISSKLRDEKGIAAFPKLKRIVSHSPRLLYQMIAMALSL